MNKFFDYIRLFFCNSLLRSNVYMLFGFLFNGVYIVLNLVLGILNADPWLITVAAFYLLFASARYLSIDSNETVFTQSSEQPYSIGILMLLISFPMVGMMFYSARRFNSREYSGFLLTVFSLYFLYSIARVIRYFYRLGKDGDTLVLRNIRLLSALVSFNSFQLSLFPSFISDVSLLSTVNFVLGSFVAIAFVFISFFTFLKCRTEKLTERSLK